MLAGATVVLAVPPPILNHVTIQIEEGMRVIWANGVPDHDTGSFPNRRNPNAIRAQTYTFRMPAEPSAAARLVPLGMHPFGVAVNGVVFDPGAAEWWRGDFSSGWQYEPLSGAIDLGVDENNGHVQPNGAYHYHGIPTRLLRRLTGGKPTMVLIGWAADGFPIYGPWDRQVPGDPASPWIPMRSSYRLKKGVRPDGPAGHYDGSFVADHEFVAGAGDLDECNGRSGPTPEFPKGIYHYHLTDTFPYIPRFFKGTPDPSFFRRAPPPVAGRPARGGRRGGPGAERPPPRE